MHRQPLLTQLDAYLQRFPEEQPVVTQFQEFVTTHPDCFERSLAVGHITASAWLLSPDQESVLLTHHRKLNIWVQLGGHVDGCPEVPQEALREAEEESGISGVQLVESFIWDLDRHRIPERKGEPEHWHYDVRFLVQAPHREFHVSDESHDLVWVPLRELEAYSQEVSLLRMRDKTLTWQANASRKAH